ncbi:hypothetical protein ACHAWO_011565 [Cyclotella atomus]|uniref:Protein HGH1 homolog n=1 Tax=Cyclotella atomus TaxID=382360 RepID=A0ABD3N1V8_9STRA
MTATMEEAGESTKLYQDLLTFLTSPRDDLRKAAAEATLSALLSTPNNEACSKLTSLNAIRPLCRIASSSDADAPGSGSGSIHALSALNILCSHDLMGNQCRLDFIEAGGIGRMIEIALEPIPKEESVRDKWRKRVNYACALLANGTREEVGAVEFVGLSFPEEAVPTTTRSSSCIDENRGEDDPVVRDAKPTATLLLMRLLNPSFVDVDSVEYKSSVKAISGNNKEYDSDLDENDLEETHPEEQDLETQKTQQLSVKANEHYDPYQQVASVLMNITQLESGRKFLMKLIHKPNDEDTTASNNTSSHLQSILPELNSPNVHRRRGIAGTLKNCCFSQDFTWWLLNVVHLDKCLLLPLAGPEELTIDEKVGLDPDYWLSGPSKVREPDRLVRLSLVEAILLLLASGRQYRETLRQRRTYVIIKMADMVEENEEIGERMNECVQYLRRDEEGEEEGSSDRRAYEVYARGMVERNGEFDCGRKLLLTDGKDGEVKENDIEVDYDHID